MDDSGARKDIERKNTAAFLRYRLKKLLDLRDAERGRGKDVDAEFIESVIALVGELGKPDAEG